jgi:glycosyltransferase involved in cell wall biosynthesis
MNDGHPGLEMRPLRLAILGTRGVPARYGGFETFAEELGARLAARGHEVTVYGRDRWVPASCREYRGMRVVRLPAPASKHFETVVHTLFSVGHALSRTADIWYVCNSANALAAGLLRLYGRTVVLNVDGLEWRRAKWGPAAKTYARASARLAATLPIHVVTDARSIQRHYQRSYGRATHYFPYGTDVGEVADDGTLARTGLASRGYVLYVSRLEPENNAHLVVDAYRSVRSDLPLVMVGDAPHAREYIERVRRAADGRVRFVGAQYGAAYHVLRSHAAAYVQSTEVGGTHPALVEAMGAGNAIVANDVPEHREVLGDAGLYFRGRDEMAATLQRVLDDPDLAGDLRSRSRARAAERFAWDAVTDAYEAWFRELVAR